MRYYIAKILYKTTWIGWYLVFKFFLRWEAVYKDEEVKNIKEGKQPVLLAINHVSWADPFIAGVAVRKTFPIRYLTIKKLFRIFLVGQVVWLYGSLKVERGVGLENSLQEAVEILKKNGTVGIFPEGKRRRNEDKIDAKPGAGYLVKETNPLIIPIFISGIFGAGFWDAVLRRKNVKVYVGRAFQYSNSHESEKQISKEIMRRVNSLERTSG